MISVHVSSFTTLSRCLSLSTYNASAISDITLINREKMSLNLPVHYNIVDCRATAENLHVAVQVARIAKDETYNFPSNIHSNFYQLFRTLKHWECNLHYGRDVYIFKYKYLCLILNFLCSRVKIFISYTSESSVKRKNTENFENSLPVGKYR